MAFLQTSRSVGLVKAVRSRQKQSPQSLDQPRAAGLQLRAVLLATSDRFKKSNRSILTQPTRALLVCVVPSLLFVHEAQAPRCGSPSDTDGNQRPSNCAERSLCRHASQRASASQNRAGSVTGWVGALVQAAGSEHQLEARWKIHRLLQVLPAACETPRRSASRSAPQRDLQGKIHS